MKKIVYAFIATFLFSFGIQLHAQQRITSKVVPLEAPKIINFTQLAEYELAHPAKKVKRYIEQGEDKEEKIKFKPKPVPAGSPVFNVTVPQPKATERVEAESPSPQISFNGALDNGTLIPPDIEGAAGSTYLIETTNQEIDIYAKTGVKKSGVSTAAFFSSTGGSGFFDPHVVYDPSYGRYIICMGGNLSNGHSGVFIAVSETSDPTGSWYEYSQDGTGNTTDLLDFPLIGYNTNWIVITGNDFSGNNVTAEIYVFGRADLYSGLAGTVAAFSDNNSFSISPAQTQDNTQATEYMISDYDGNSGGNGYMEICTITGAVNSPVYAAVNTIGVNQPWSETGVNASQEGSTETLDVPDTRVGAGPVYINGSLWFCHHVFLPASTPTHDAVDWWQIDPVAPSVQQFGRLNDPTGAINYFYGSISVNSIGDALIGYCESGTNMYPSASYSFHANTDAAGVLEDTYIAKAGVASYYKTLGGGRNRYGDFTGTGVDATDNSFWNFSEWANAGNNWGTYITNVLSTSDTTCISASGLITSFITDKSATFSWSAIRNASAYIIQYREVGTLIWTIDTITTTTYSIAGLTGSTNYEWQVQTLCTVGGTSSFTASATFLTLIPCNATAPVSSPQSVCSGNSTVLTATGSDSLYWYSIYAGGTPIGKGSTFTTPPLTSNTTYYAESDIYPAVQFVGPTDDTFGTGSVFTNNSTYRDLIINCTTSVTLVSVLVYAQGAGNRTITLMDQLQNTLAQTTVNLPDGASRVPLNFVIPVGNGLQLGIIGNVNLYRNNAGANFPYTLANEISITGTNATGLPGYYYYFYDWQIQAFPCKSLRTPVNVSVLDPVAAFVFSAYGDSVAFADQSSGANSWLWDFGDGDTSSLQNPSHIYLTNETFNVKEIACNGNCCDTIYHNVTIITTGLSSQDENEIIKVYPNPAKDNMQITFGPALKVNACTLNLSNSIGQTIFEKLLSPAEMAEGYTLNTSLIPKGVYILNVRSEQDEFIRKIIKE